MHAIAWRADVVKQLALLFEGRPRIAIVGELEQHVGANVVAQLRAHVLIIAADVANAKSTHTIGVTNGVDPCRGAQHRRLDGGNRQPKWSGQSRVHHGCLPCPRLSRCGLVRSTHQAVLVRPAKGTGLRCPATEAARDHVGDHAAE